MGAWKNALKSHRKIHRERSQPKSRRHLGLLQKHKDYVLRAKNYHRKQDLLKVLHEKAQNRNPDEFYFRMISEKTVDGKHFVDTDEKLSRDELKLVRSQDLNYINFKLAGEKKKIDRLRAEVQLIRKPGDKKENTHTIFVSNKRELLKYDKKVSNDTECTEQVDSEDTREEDMPVGDSKVSRELKQRMARERTLRKLSRKMEIDKAVNKEKPIITRRSDGKVIYKWKKERKK